jgi:diadenylate cyclase
MFERFGQLLQRVSAYSPAEALAAGLEIVLIWILVYAVVRFIQGTRAAGALKGLLLFVLVATLVFGIIGEREMFQRLAFLYQNFLTVAAIALIVIFQPELRRGFIRLGETRWFRTESQAGGIVGAVVDAAAYLSKARFGAIIVIEREIGLRGLVKEGGTPIGGAVSARLLQTIFFPNSALHDLAVVIADGAIQAAGVQLPLAEPSDMPDPGLGSRHRAAVGLTKECDALVVVVSEETGAISIAERGRLERGLTPEQLRDELTRRLEGTSAIAHPAPKREKEAKGEGKPEGKPEGKAGAAAVAAAGDARTAKGERTETPARVGSPKERERSKDAERRGVEARASAAAKGAGQ